MEDDNDAAACLFCGEPERVEMFQIWRHEFMIETCCEGLHESVAREMADDPEWAKTLLRRISVEELAGHRQPGQALDALLVSHIRPGPLPIAQTAKALATNPGLTGTGPSPSP